MLLNVPKTLGGPAEGREGAGPAGGQGAAPGTRTRPRRGEFRNGQFVDDEIPEMRHIVYDLSPERMERVWARYKSRWERTDEIERVKELEKKKIEFRRRMDLKRARMDQMSKAEKEEFLYRIRLHRPDAVEDFDILNHNKTQNKNTTSSESFSSAEKSAGATNQRKDETEYADLERKILRERFGLTDEEIDRIDRDDIMGKSSNGGDRKNWRGAGGGGHERQGGSDLHQRDSDPIYAGLDSSR